MKYSILLFLLLALATTSCKAQKQQPRITVKGTQFLKETNRILISEPIIGTEVCWLPRKWAIEKDYCENWI